MSATGSSLGQPGRDSKRWSRLCVSLPLFPRPCFLSSTYLGSRASQIHQQHMMPGWHPRRRGRFRPVDGIRRLPRWCCVLQTSRKWVIKSPFNVIWINQKYSQNTSYKSMTMWKAPPTSKCTNQVAVGDRPQLTQTTPVMRVCMSTSPSRKHEYVVALRA